MLLHYTRQRAHTNDIVFSDVPLEPRRSEGMHQPVSHFFTWTVQERCLYVSR